MSVISNLEDPNLTICLLYVNYNYKKLYGKTSQSSWFIVRACIKVQSVSCDENLHQESC